ncbi:MAG: hypothetical protein A2X64_06245 [Ignavibacteria bacterium GWF2_33_9]|nr:MAG: hypothetical protein A2X64_06245 [Ignavibacteria bacterium GWF2_33_9]
MEIIKKYRFFTVTLLFLCVLGVLSMNKTSYSVQTLEDIQAKLQLFSPVIEKLRAAGVDSMFIDKLISDSLVVFEDKYLQLDVPYRTVTSDKPKQPTTKYYSSVMNDMSIRKIEKFIDTYSVPLNDVEMLYKVDKETLASLLMVETRHGEYLGYHNVASVYLCLALADQPEFIEYNMKRMKKKYNLSKGGYVQVKQKMVNRSKTKAKWALNEIIALYKISEKIPHKVTEIYGSYAGAFGIPQFLPSSYNKFAVDGDSDGEVNLFNFNDAIYSCANYLNKHGYGPTTSEKRDAIYSYNHSQKYVNTIIELARRVKNNMGSDSVEAESAIEEVNDDDQ